MIKRKNGKKKGFSLIELIIVLAVMAIIAMIAIPNFSAVRDNSKDKADTQSCETIKRTVLMLVADETVTGSGTLTVSFNSDKSIATVAEATGTDTIKGEDKIKEALLQIKKPQGKVDKTVDGNTTKVDASKFQIKVEASGEVNVKTIE